MQWTFKFVYANVPSLGWVQLGSAEGDETCRSLVKYFLNGSFFNIYEVDIFKLFKNSILNVSFKNWEWYTVALIV